MAAETPLTPTQIMSLFPLPTPATGKFMRFAFLAFTQRDTAPLACLLATVSRVSWTDALAWYAALDGNQDAPALDGRLEAALLVLEDGDPVVTAANASTNAGLKMVLRALLAGRRLGRICVVDPVDLPAGEDIEQATELALKLLADFAHTDLEAQIRVQNTEGKTLHDLVS